MNKLKVVVLTGAGISAESGINTFRDVGGLWENYRIEDVATPQGWERNPELVLGFYNDMRKHIKTCKPNRAHLTLVELEASYEVHIITQNVDDLHERAGSTNVLHLHGEITRIRSEADREKTYEAPDEVKLGDLAEDGYQLRPHIVWFYEPVPMLDPAITLVSKADILVVIGTSMSVYPAVSLVEYSKVGIPIIVINPQNHHDYLPKDILNRITFIQKNATHGTGDLVEELRKYSVSL